MAIIVIGDPQFIDLVRITRLPPKAVSTGLALLFQKSRISKDGKGRYHSLFGYDDHLLSCIDIRKLSKLRALTLAHS